jgi:non-heme chloroperoxidase
MRIRSLQHRYARLLLLPLCSFSLACSEGELIAAPLAASLQVVPSEKIVGGGGLKLAAYEAGKADGPPIVFIHGFSGNHLTWERQFSGSLAAEFRLVAFDLRGHGASDKPLEAVRYTNSALWAEDLAAVIRVKNLNRPVLVGWSYGGYVIADYIRKFGDGKIGGVVFLGSSTKNGTPDAADFLTPELLALFPSVLSADVQKSN